MEHESYPMPVLSEEERNAAYQRLLIKGSILKRALVRSPNSDVLKNDLIGVQIALASLTAKRAAIVEMTHGNGWNPPETRLSVCSIEGMKPGDTKDLYLAPCLYSLKPVVLNRGVLKSDGGIWYTDKTVAQILRDAGYEVDL